MENRIEKMNKMRKNILLGVFIGSVFALGLLMFPSFNATFHFTRRFHFPFPKRYYDTAFVLWALTLLLFMARYWLYRKKLKKDLSLRLAVNDERVNLNWLRAYRVAFIVVMSVAIFWDWYYLGFFPLKWRIMLPDGPWLILYGAVISLVGAFLSYNRGAKSGNEI